MKIFAYGRVRGSGYNAPTGNNVSICSGGARRPNSHTKKTILITSDNVKPTFFLNVVCTSAWPIEPLKKAAWTCPPPLPSDVQPSYKLGVNLCKNVSEAFRPNHNGPFISQLTAHCQVFCNILNIGMFKPHMTFRSVFIKLPASVNQHRKNFFRMI